MGHRWIRWLVASIMATAFCAVAAPARAESWALAGTFNNWALSDPAWALAPSATIAGGFSLERRFEAGQYRFKFVRDGAWDKGHLGAALLPNRLEQPGRDVELRILGAGTYRITLEPARGQWSLTFVRADQPMIVARVKGARLVGRPFLLSLGYSLYSAPAPDQVSFAITSNMQNLALADNPGGHPYDARIVPSTTGLMQIFIRMQDGSAVARDELAIEVEEAAVLRYTLASDKQPRVVEFEQQAGGMQRALLELTQDTSFASIEVQIGRHEPVREGAVLLKAGSYVAEIRRGAVVRREDPAGGSVLLEPGNWRRFVYPAPLNVDSVHLTGDLNNWAMPGQPGAIEMQPLETGQCHCIVRVPAGTQRYNFVLNGESMVLDPSARQTAKGPSGQDCSVVLIGPAPSDFPKPEPGKINQQGFRHDPGLRRDACAISAELGLADLACSALPGDADVVDVEVTGGSADAVPLVVPMSRSMDGAGFDRWSARVARAGPGPIRYRFALHDGSALWRSPEYTLAIDPKPPVPAWAMGAVWYQIFVERFRNGNGLNDPHGPGVTLKPWNSDWYRVSSDEEQAWRKRAGLAEGVPLPAHQGGPLYLVVWDRRYGGDLQGVAQKLDDLKVLGVDAIYLNPVFEAESMHKYDATDYRHIDDNFAAPASAGRVPESFVAPNETVDARSWAWTAADQYFVKEFLPACKAKGIRVVIDGVFNHTGKSFFAFKDLQEKGSASQFKAWYIPEFDDQGKLKNWVSWFNTGALPKFAQTQTGDLVPPVKEHIFGITRRWMDPNGDGDPSDGVDGWRLDVALDVGLPFWRDWRNLVKSINPNALIIAEIWDDATPYLTGDAFDTQMHYPFAAAAIQWLDGRPGSSSEKLGSALDAAFGDAPQTSLIHQNLFGSHDTDRFVSMLANPGRVYDQGNRIQDDSYPYNEHRPSEEIYKRSLLGVALQATYVGAPMIYYGDEIGMWGADDPSDRKPYPWPDTGAPENTEDRPEPGLKEQYGKWFNLRRDASIGPTLKWGAVRHLDSGSPDVFAFERQLNSSRVAVVLNRGSSAFDAAGVLPTRESDRTVPPVSARLFVLSK